MINPALPPTLPPSKATDDAFAFASALLQILSDPRVSHRQLDEFKAATAEHHAAKEEAARARADFEAYQKKQIADFEAMAHARTVALDERERSHHDSVEAFHAEQVSERKRAAEMTAQAERDRAQAADMLERAKRKVAAFEAN
jgi:hypothetical protein